MLHVSWSAYVVKWLRVIRGRWCAATDRWGWADRSIVVVVLASCIGYSSYRNWVVFLNLNAFELPKDGSDKLCWVLTQLEVQARVACQSEAIDAIQVLDGWQTSICCGLLVNFEGQAMRISAQIDKEVRISQYNHGPLTLWLSQQSSSWCSDSTWASQRSLACGRLSSA